MTTLEEFIKLEPKEDVYAFYEEISPHPKPYAKISRDGIYKEIIAIYNADPEIILKIISVEEINALRELLDENKKIEEYGYIEYLLLKDLKDKYLIIKGKTEYYIPEDIFNYVKMAINLFNQREYFYKDIIDNIIVGLTRIYNVLSFEDLKVLLQKYNTNFTLSDLKVYIMESYYLKNKVTITIYQNKEYLTDSYFVFYEDVLKLRNSPNLEPKYTLEEVISIGKYRINLFKEPILKFLNFLEGYLKREYITVILEDLIVYAGMHLNNLTTLKNISCDVDILFEEAKKVVEYLPNWLQDNSANELSSANKNPKKTSIFKKIFSKKPKIDEMK